MFPYSISTTDPVLLSNLIIAILIGIMFVCWPKQSIIACTFISLKIEILVLNYKLKWFAWRQYKKLVEVCKEHGLPPPGDFLYVDIWDRLNND